MVRSVNTRGELIADEKKKSSKTSVRISWQTVPNFTSITLRTNITQVAPCYSFRTFFVPR